MNRLFDRWNGDGGHSSLFGFGGYPPMNVWEEGDEVFVEAELPGQDLKDLEIYVTGGNQLTIKGERKAVLRRQGRLAPPGTDLRPVHADADAAVPGERRQSGGASGERRAESQAGQT